MSDARTDPDQGAVDPGALAIKAGEAYFLRGHRELADAAHASGDPFLFYAGYLAGIYGHMAAALGADVAEQMTQGLRATFANAARECEQRRAH